MTTTYTAQSSPSSDGYYDTNLINLGAFLMANGYSRNAAAGIAGCVAGESKGNPESKGSGGGGLIGWTPLPNGMVTGNATKDLNFQFGQILVYNRIWSAYISTLNAQTTALAAADYYSEMFERPAVTNSDVRSVIVTMVYNALASVTPPTPPTPVPPPKAWAYGAPGPMSASVVGGEVSVKLTWEAPATTNPPFTDPPAPTGYIVWVYTGKATKAALAKQLNVASTSVTLSGMTVGTTYTVHVSASSPAPQVGKDVFATVTFTA